MGIQTTDAEVIFQAAREKRSPAERAGFLDEVCRNDAALRADVEGLLQAHDQATDARNEATVRMGTVWSSAPSLEKPGTVIGHYRLRHLIGEGGFGSVYEAEQHKPLRRDVALKIIKLGMDSREVIARFDVERQALALMDHANIAKVLDAGVTETGRPYFVMDLVKGMAITHYCDTANLSIPQRLELFIAVCRAVQHAHQKGIIHRDIKPSNVLVTVQDGQALPKVIDFGIAKATCQRLTERSYCTDYLHFIGTPQYISPEQAEMSRLDVDTRTDIYSLGVLLYELLTGTTPFSDRGLCDAGMSEIQRVICDEDPPRPSARLERLGDELTAVAKHRRTEPRALSQLIRGDLDWIVMKALDKDRTRRYATADALARDVQRHLNHENIEAQPPSVSLRVRKFVRRNRGLVTGAAVVLLLIMAGSATSLWLAARALRAEAVAQHRLDEVEQEKAKADAVLKFLQDMLVSADPEGEGRDVRVVEVLDRAARDLEKGQAAPPETEAAIRTALGRAYLNLGRLSEAETQLERALAISTRLYGEDHLEVASGLSYVAQLRLRQEQLEAAAEMSERVLAILHGNLGSEHELVAFRLHDLGVVRMHQARLEEAESLLREALEMTRRLKGDSAEEAATTMTVLGKLVVQKGEYQEAEALHREALAIYRDLHGDEHATVAMACANLATVCRATGRLEEAEALARDALEIRRAAYGDDSPTVASSLYGLGVILNEMGDYAGAEDRLEEALGIYRRTSDNSHAHVVTTRLMLAKLTDDRGDSEAAAEQFVAVIEALSGGQSEQMAPLAKARARYGVCLTRLGRYEQAEAQLLDAYQKLSDCGYGAAARTTASWLVNLYEAWGRPEAAKPWRSRASSAPDAE